ncbi:MAG: hypothetical protein ACI30N_03040 [Muribaculaceae bacterium]
MKTPVRNFVVALLASVAVAAKPCVPDIVPAEGLAQADIAVRCPGEWALIWDYTDSANYNCAEIKTLLASDDIYGGRSAVNVYTVKDGRETLVGRQDVTHSEKETGLRLTRNIDGEVRLIAGDNTPVSFSVPFAGIPGSLVCVRSDKGPVYKNVELIGMVHDVPAPFESLEQLTEYLAASKDSIEGIWEYQDRNMPAGKIVPGGNYEVAVVRIPDSDRYGIYYLGGGEIYVDRWEPFMRKGTLVPTVFPRAFDMEWIDASRSRKLVRENYATVTMDNSLLTLNFPLLKSVIRFRRKL